jgi:3-hydroxymyristoyl/3-hydroxydecanoyl-(acyl carrier protein) dehydratase
MPGVLQIEAMAQLGGFVALQPPLAEPGQDFFFGGVDNVKWRKPLVPGVCACVWKYVCVCKDGMYIYVCYICTYIYTTYSIYICTYIYVLYINNIYTICIHVCICIYT